MSTRYVEVTRRLGQWIGAAAGVLTLMVVISIWGEWRRIAILSGLTIALVPLNLWLNARQRHAVDPARIELARAILNLLGTAASLLFAGSPLLGWLWLPFVALSYDQLGRRVAVATLVVFCLMTDVIGWIHHVPWMFPVAYTGFAAFCSAVAYARQRVIGEMLQESDAQRAELAASHQRLEAEIAARQRAEMELVQAQKLEAVGRLASGVAHEINTPIQFVGDNVQFARDSIADLLSVAAHYRALAADLIARHPDRAAAAALAAVDEEVDLDYLTQQLPAGLDTVIAGLGRVSAIVSSLKRFAHRDATDKAPADLNAALASTIVMAHHEYRYVADVETDFGVLPHVRCHVGELNQVFLNLLVNAAHAVADAVAGTERRGRIRIGTRRSGDSVVITVSDDGLGIPEAIRGQIFDPFFTTKELGRGTGQGLAIARNVVVAKHGGALSFETECGKGTTFVVRIPIDGAGSEPARLAA